VKRSVRYLALFACLAGCDRGDVVGESNAATAERAAVPGIETAVVEEESVRDTVFAACVVAAEAEPPTLRDARTQLDEAQARERLAAQQLRRLEELSGVVAPRKELEAARAEQAVAAAAAERARLALAAFGARAPDARLAREETWASAQILQRDLARVEAGAAARFRADAYPGRSFDGQVDAVPAFVDPASGSGPARVRLVDAEHLLRPGMTGGLVIDAGAPRGALVVPTASVVYDGVQPVVFALEAGGRFVPRAVQLGVTRDGRVEVRGDLAPGAQVATTGAASLLSALRLSGTSAQDAE